MFKFHPIDLTDLIAITALSIGFILAIYGNMNELASSVATGFFGYVGGVATGVAKNSKAPTHNAVKDENNDTLDQYDVK